MEPVVLRKWGLSCLALCGLLLINAPQYADARQNVLNSGVSARYEYQDREYDASSGAGVNGVVVLDDRLGDEKNYIVSPRISFSSQGIDDLFQFTVAPELNYDDIYNTTDIDWDLRVQEVKHLTRNWTLTVEDGYFLGDDPVIEDERRTAQIVPGTIRVRELEVVGAPADNENTALTGRFGHTRFWTNNFTVSTEYVFAEDSTVGVGYNFAVLRNKEDVDVYTEYDRHDVSLGLGYRFNSTWMLDNQGSYSKGLFDEDQNLGGLGNNIFGRNRNSEDLEEYQFQSRLNYTKNPHLLYFGEYRYIGTDYESAAEEDYNINEFIVGFDYDFSPHLSFTISGGPVIGSFDNSPTDTDYVAYGGLQWQVQHGEFTLNVEKGYDQNDFDGRGSGLTEFWSTGASFGYQFSEHFNTLISANYSNYDRLQDSRTNLNVSSRPPDFGQTLYNEETYEAGVLLSYTFARWYQLSGGYRYLKNESDLRNDIEGNYDEHQLFVELSWGKEIFRW